MKNKKIAAGPTLGLGGRVKVEVLNSKTKEPVEFDFCGNRVKETPWKHNLIMNNWLEKFTSQEANFTVSDAGDNRAFLAYCYIGTGSTDNKTDSGAITASQSGTTITLSGALAAVVVGRVIKWDSGEFSTIVSGGGTSWETHSLRSKTVSSGAFTVFHTEEDALGNHHKRSTNTASADVTRTGYNLATGTATETIVYEFTAEAVPITINEIGFGPGNIIHGENLFSRIKLDGGVTLLAAEQLRVTYVMSYTLGPLVDTVSELSISGWTTGTVTERCVDLVGCLNLSEHQDRAGALHPSGIASWGDNNHAVVLHTNSTIPAVTSNIGSQTGFVDNGVSIDEDDITYEGAGSYAYVKTVTFGPTNSNSAAIRGIAIAGTSPSRPAFMCVFANTVEKANTHNLTVNFRVTYNPEYVA